MIEENACVIVVNKKTTLVETVKKTACNQCSAKNGCGTGIISQTLGVRKSQFEVENPINSNVGDQVVIGIEEKNLIKSSIAVYLVPILCLLMAAWSGEQLFRIFGVGSSDVVTIVTGLAGFITGLLWLKHYNFKISQNSEFYPVILRKQTGMHTGSEE